MLKSDDMDLVVLSGLVSFVFMPFLFFMSIVGEIYFIVGLLTTFSIFWVSYLVKENKYYKLRKLRALVKEIDKEPLTKND